MTDESKLREEAEDALASAPQPVAWTDDQVIRFASMVLIQGNKPESIEQRLNQFRKREALAAAPQPMAPGAVDAQAGPSDAEIDAVFDSHGYGVSMVALSKESYRNEARHILARFAAPAGEYLALRETLASNRGYRTGVEDGKALGAAAAATASVPGAPVAPDSARKALESILHLADAFAAMRGTPLQKQAVADAGAVLGLTTAVPVSDAAAQASQPTYEAVAEILKGIDGDMDVTHGGWWETTTLAEFGAAKLAAIKALFDSGAQASQQPAYTVAGHVVGFEDRMRDQPTGNSRPVYFREEFATPPSVSGIGEAAEPVAWFAFGDSNGPVPLELYGWDEKACKNAVLTYARAGNWKGTVEGYLMQQGWTLRPVYLSTPATPPLEAQPQGAAVAATKPAKVQPGVQMDRCPKSGCGQQAVTPFVWAGNAWHRACTACGAEWDESAWLRDEAATPAGSTGEGAEPVAGDPYADLRAALMEGPTPGPWGFGTFAVGLLVVDEVHGKHAPIARVAHPESLALPWDATESSRQSYNDANYIAACHPETIRRLLADADRAAPVAVEQADALTQAARDVLAERRRQVESEGWTPEHDDAHDLGQLARAGAAYAAQSRCAEDAELSCGPTNWWPWDRAWWKPNSRRGMLVKAGALILAEVERLDRAALQATKEDGDRG